MKKQIMNINPPKSVRANLETVYATQKAVSSTRVSVEPTQQIFDFLSASALYLTETMNQNSSTI